MYTLYRCFVARVSNDIKQIDYNATFAKNVNRFTATDSDNQSPDRKKMSDFLQLLYEIAGNVSNKCTLNNPNSVIIAYEK